MGKTTRTAQPIYLDPDKAQLLNELAADTRVAKAVYLREAVDDLLVKYRKLKPPRKPKP
jgi:predicted DNA-binding protein